MMKTVMIKTWVIFIFFACSSLHAFDAPSGVEIFEEPDFGGAQILVYNDIADMSEVQKQCGSVRIPQGWELVVYSEKDFLGFSTVISRDEPDLLASRSKDGTIGSIRIIEKNEFWPDLPVVFDQGVVLFSEPGFHGDYEIVTGKVSNLMRRGIGADRVNSVFVHPGYGVHLFGRTNYDGPSVTLTKSDSDLQLTPVGRNNLSSLIVYPLGQSESHQGHIDDWDPNILVNIDLPVYDWEEALAVTVGAILIHSIVKSAQENSARDSGSGITLYSESDYSGMKQTFRRNVRKMKKTWFGQNQVNSVEVAPGYEITLYEFPRYKGRSLFLSHSISSLDDTDLIGLRISSIKIRYVGE